MGRGVRLLAAVLAAAGLQLMNGGDSELSRRLREAQARFDLLTKENAEATVQMINAKLENQLAKVAEIQQQIMPRIAEEKNRILNEIRSLIESEDSSEGR